MLVVCGNVGNKKKGKSGHLNYSEKEVAKLLHISHQ